MECGRNPAHDTNVLGAACAGMRGIAGQPPDEQNRGSGLEHGWQTRQPIRFREHMKPGWHVRQAGGHCGVARKSRSVESVAGLCTAGECAGAAGSAGDDGVSDVVKSSGPSAALGAEAALLLQLGAPEQTPSSPQVRRALPTKQIWEHPAAQVQFPQSRVTAAKAGAGARSSSRRGRSDLFDTAFSFLALRCLSYFFLILIRGFNCSTECSKVAARPRRGSGVPHYPRRPRLQGHERATRPRPLTSRGSRTPTRSAP